MASIIARKVPNTPAGKPRQWLYWTGEGWDADRAKAKRYEKREDAFPDHEKLVKSQAWAVGTNPLVIDRG